MSAAVTMRGALALGAALAALLAAAPAVRAQGAPADSAMHAYFRAVADSTDAYFGLSAEPADTAGLDSALAYGLTLPPGAVRRQARLSFAPALAFNRALGAVYGGSATLREARSGARLTGLLQWANGPDDWYGHGELGLNRVRPGRETGTSLRVAAGRRFESLNRDHWNRTFSSIAALMGGADRHSYVRRDGAWAEVTGRGPATWATLGWRNERESPLATTTYWTLTGADLELVPNTPAAFGRASETRLTAGARLPWAPFTAEATAWNAGGALGGDFAYHRYRATVGGAIGLGRHVALATQAEYGRLLGDVLPQNAFYLGGAYSLHTVESQSLAGAGRTLARVDLIVHDDLPTLLRLRSDTAFPLQVGAFAVSAARWGHDPSTQLARATARDWPRAEDWLSEAGVSLMYRPGLPDPDTYMRFDVAWPLGPGGRELAIQMMYKRTLHLLGRR